MKTYRLAGLFLFLMGIYSVLYAQQTRTIKGRILTLETGSKEKQPLPSASVVVLSKSDSAFVKGTTSDKEGRFTIRFQPQNKKIYLLKTSFMGMQSVFRVLKDSVSADVGTIVLKDDDIRISEVVVTAKLKEIVMEGDTTVINAAAYKTPEGSYLEDLVKRIPGLVYNKNDKSLSYNGQTISEINVNGESFFSGSKETALENLPANLVSKLRVYDKRSKEEEFTGVDDGKKNYVLDLQTKDELNETWLGNTKVGFGNNRKKDLEAQANYFRKNGDNISLMMRSTNRYQNSTYKDNINNSIGLNITKKLGEDLRLSGSVNYGLNRNGNISSTYQEQYLTSGNQYSSSVSENNSKNRNISGNFFGDGKIDKRTRFNFMGNFSLSPNQGENSNQNATFDAPPGIDQNSFFDNFESIPNAIRINRSESRSLSKGQSNNYMWMASVMRRMDEKGNTTISLNLQNSDTWGTNKNFSLSNTTYYRLKDKLGNDSVLFRNQYLQSPTRNGNWRMGLSLSQLIVKKIRLNAAYAWSTQYERDNRDTYELSSLTTADTFGKLPDDYQEGYVDSLSNRSRSRFKGHDLSLGINYNDTTWTLNAMVVVTPQKRTVERKIGKLNADTTMNTIDYRPMIWVGWRKKQLQLNLNYDGMTRQPSLSDLMPLTDNSDPLFITRGNPDLKQMFTHNLRLSFQNQAKGLSANVGWRMEQNSVTQVMIYDSQTGGRETYPININGNWGVSAGANWWKRMGKSFSLRLDAYGNRDNRVSMINEDKSQDPKKSTTRASNLNCEAHLSYQPTWGGLDLSTGWQYQYSLNSVNDNNTFTRNYRLGLESYVDLPFGLQLRTDATYELRGGTNIQKDDKNEILWNAGATYSFLKKKTAELSAYWSDILSDKKNYTRSVTSDGFYEYRSQQIRGYFIVSFKYNFRTMM